MRVLALGPMAAKAAAKLGPASAGELGRLPLLSLDTHLGWLAGRLLAAGGAELAASKELSGLVQALSAELRRLTGPALPMEQGRRLHVLADEWEARFWKKQAGRQKARPGELTAWRNGLERLLARAC